MSLNKVLVNGKLPRFEAIYTKGTDSNKSFLTWCISVKRDYKKPEEQYYPEDLLKFKAFGPKADFIMNNFAQGDGLMLVGKLQIEDDYTDKNGNQVKGGMVIMVDEVSFADAKISNTAANKASAPTVPGGIVNKPSIPGVPGAINKPSIPGVPGSKPTFGGGRPSFPGSR